jgi:hypothetical protein
MQRMKPRCPFRYVMMLTLTASLSVPGCAHRSAPLAPPSPRFYQPHAYGSASQFNPFSQIVNEGFNTLALVAEDLRLDRQPFRRSLRNLGETLQHSGETLEGYGWGRLVRNELLPLTGKDGGQWVPNWLDHLAGSGMVSARMTEWYQAHRVPHPALMSYLTMSASHVLNEVIERPVSRSADALVDLLLFDNLGFLAFRSERVQRLLSGDVTFTSWARQPTISPDGAVENAGQSFVVHAPLPGTTQWKFFYYFGNTHLLGTSRQLGARGLALSGGAGWGSNVVIVTDSMTDTRTVTLGPKAGIFLERNSSLLASVLWDATRRTAVTINVYPGWIGNTRWQPGVWVGVPERGGRWQLGVVGRLGVGAAIRGAEHPQ